MNINSQKKLVSLINAFGNSSLKDGEIIIDYAGKPFQNLMQVLHELEEIKKNYDFDILVYAIKKAILKRYQTTPFQIDENNGIEIIKEIIYTLKSNMADHLIIIPIQLAQFENLIKIDNLTFIPEKISREKKLLIIAKLAKKTLAETIEIAEHTENSRSRDFFKYPLLCVKQTHQTSTIDGNSLNITKIIISAIRCFYYGNISNTTKDNTSVFYSIKTERYEKASHLAVYSKENWRQGHDPLNLDTSIDFDISWLESKELKLKFKKFIKSIYFNRNLDEFNFCFLNALILFNDSIKQNTSISTIIITAILESILTKNKYEKRLRLAAVLPRLMQCSKSEQSKLSKKLDELYHKRNEFVHSAESVIIDYNFEDSEPTLLETCRKITAQLILNYPIFEKNLEKYMQDSNKKNRMENWEKYIDSIFQNIIY